MYWSKKSHREMKRDEDSSKRIRTDLEMEMESNRMAIYLEIQ